MPADRPDWQDGQPTHVLTPVPLDEGQDVVAEIEAEYPLPADNQGESETPAPSVDLVADWPAEKVELAQQAALNALAGLPDGFSGAFDSLPLTVQQKTVEVLAANPHLTGADLIDAVGDKLTLEEKAAF